MKEQFSMEVMHVFFHLIVEIKHYHLKHYSKAKTKDHKNKHIIKNGNVWKKKNQEYLKSKSEICSNKKKEYVKSKSEIS